MFTDSLGVRIGVSGLKRYRVESFTSDRSGLSCKETD